MPTDYEFTADWTSHHFNDWLRWLGHLAGRPADVVEIGCFEGRGTLWFCEHLLTHPDSQLYAIDPWDYSAEQAIVPGAATRIAADYDWSDVRRRWEHNVAGYRRKITLHAKPSRLALQRVPNCIDAAYIDGSHLACAALEDAVLLWTKLWPGGILIWDDYDWPLDREAPPGWAEQLLTPKLGIDAFLECYANQYDELEHSNWQIKIRKKPTAT